MVDSVALEGGQMVMVSEPLMPQRAKHLTIRGALYLQCGILPAYMMLWLPGKRLKDTLVSGSVQHMLVRPHQPRLAS
ncbi:hypothetical protein H4S02_002521 [Coemansia sp. RSA 2611]|nr:hypothetical protein H4S02_002521 [Coemansia sp. RSA 2611]